MKIKTVSVFLACLLSISLLAQEYNYVDENGLRQGKWRKFHVNSEKLFYTGQFNNDKPVGNFIYYYKDGKTKGLMNYDAVGHHCRSEAFYENGEIMAKGNYINQKKDSTWHYFTKTKTLKSIENWDEGVKHGVEITYFSDKEIAEKLNWNQGVKEGEFEQYFSKDVLKLKGHYLDNEFDGVITFYYPNGKVETEGKYVNGLRDGTWYYYNEDGSVHLQALYSNGKLLKEKKETGVFTEYTADNILLSEINYLKGKKEGSFKIYHEGAEWVIEPVFDQQSNETYNQQVLKGHAIKMKGSYKADKLNGIVKHYNKAGVLTHEEHFVDGVLQ